MAPPPGQDSTPVRWSAPTGTRKVVWLNRRTIGPAGVPMPSAKLGVFADVTSSGMLADTSDSVVSRIRPCAERTWVKPPLLVTFTGMSCRAPAAAVAVSWVSPLPAVTIRLSPCACGLPLLSLTDMASWTAR